MLLTLYDQYGSVKATLSPNDTSTQDKEIQGDNVLSLSFTLYEYVGIDVNDYVDFEGERYWAVEKYLPNEKSTVEWEYNVKLYGIESLIKRFLVLKTVDGANEAVFTLTARPIEHMRLIVQNINDGMDHTTNFKVGTVEGTDNVVIDYTGKYCDEGLKELAEAVGVEWWIEGETVNLCRCEHGEELTLAYGAGLTRLDRDVADNAKFYTRLFPIGSSRNIDPEQYGASRLQLPGGVKYVDVNADRYGIIHHYEQEAFSGIYPRRIGVVSSVRSENVQDSDGNPFTIYYFKDNSLTFDPNDYEIGGLVKHVSFQEGSELAGLGVDDDHYFEVNYNSETREFEIITIWPYDDDTQLPGGTLVPNVNDSYILWNIRMPDEYYGLAEREFQSAVNEYNTKHALDVSRYKAPTDHVWIEDEEVDLYIGRRIRLESQEYFPDTGYRASRITRISRQVTLPSQMELEISDAISTRTLDKIDDAISDVKNYTGTLVGSVNVPDIIRSWDTTRPTDNNLYSARKTHKEFLNKNSADTANGLIRFLSGLKVGSGIFGIGSDGAATLYSLLTNGGRGISSTGAATIESAQQASGDNWHINSNGDAKFKDITGTGSINYPNAVFQTLTAQEAHFFQLLIDEVKSVGGQMIITPANCEVVMVRAISEYQEVEDLEGDSETLAVFSDEGTPESYRCYFKASDGSKEISQQFRENDLAIHYEFDTTSTRNYWRKVVMVSSAKENVTIDGQTVACHWIDLSNLNGGYKEGSTVPQAGDAISQLGNTTDTSRQNAIIISAYNIPFIDSDSYNGDGEGIKAPLFAQYTGINSFRITVANRLNVMARNGNTFKGTFKTSTGQDVTTMTLYTWIAYSANADGSNFSASPDANTEYIGFAYNKSTQTWEEGTTASAFTWSKYKGEPGDTPTISIDSNGYWVINGTTTEVKAEGTSPTITIVDGYWYVNGANTNVKAEGKDGDNAVEYRLVPTTESAYVDENKVLHYNLSYKLMKTNGSSTSFVRFANTLKCHIYSGTESTVIASSTDGSSTFSYSGTANNYNDSPIYYRVELSSGRTLIDQRTVPVVMKAGSVFEVADDAITARVQSGEIVSAEGLRSRNLWTNGAFAEWDAQGGSPLRHHVEGGVTAVPVTSDLPAGFHTGLKMTTSAAWIGVSAGTGSNEYAQPILPLTAGKTYTLSWYAKSRLNATVYVGINNVGAMIVRTSTEWQRYSYTFSVPSGDNAGGVVMFLPLQADDVYLTGIQLEEGTEVTPWKESTTGLEGDVKSVTNRVSAVEQTASGLSSTVSEHTASINSLNGQMTTKASQTQLTQTAEEIRLEAEKTVKEGYKNLLEDTDFALSGYDEQDNPVYDVDAWRVKTYGALANGSSMTAVAPRWEIVQGTGGEKAFRMVSDNMVGHVADYRYNSLLQQATPCVTAGKWYTLSWWQKGTVSKTVTAGGVEVQAYSEVELVAVHWLLYSDSSTDRTVIVDGVEQSTKDPYLEIKFLSTGEWVRHSVTFRAEAGISPADAYMEWRMYNQYWHGAAWVEQDGMDVQICMPRLEQSKYAHAYRETVYSQSALISIKSDTISLLVNALRGAGIIIDLTNPSRSQIKLIAQRTGFYESVDDQAPFFEVEKVHVSANGTEVQKGDYYTNIISHNRIKGGEVDYNLGLSSLSRTVNGSVQSSFATVAYYAKLRDGLSYPASQLIALYDRASSEYHEFHEGYTYTLNPSSNKRTNIVYLIGGSDPSAYDMCLYATDEMDTNGDYEPTGAGITNGWLVVGMDGDEKDLTLRIVKISGANKTNGNNYGAKIDRDAAGTPVEYEVRVNRLTEYTEDGNAATVTYQIVSAPSGWSVDRNSANETLVLPEIT